MSKPVDKKKNIRDIAGPAHWTVLHVNAAAYDGSKEQANAYVQLVYSYAALFPCKHPCREHWKELLKKLPVENYLKDNNTLFFWSYTAHDLVNQDINKANPLSKRKVSPPFDICKAYWFGVVGEVCKECTV